MFLTLIAGILAGLHQALAGFASAGPLVVAGLRFWRLPPESQAGDFLQAAGKGAVVALVATFIVGAAAGLVLYGTNDAYAAMLSRFPSRAYWMAGAELVFTLAIYALWLATWRRWQSKPGRHAVLAAVGATNLLYHFPPFMIVQGMLLHEPHIARSQVIDRPIFLTLMRTPEVIFPTVHFAGQGALVSCALVAYLSANCQSEPYVLRLRRSLAIIALFAVGLQMLSGVGTLILLDPGNAHALTGGRTLPTLGLLLSFTLTLLLLRLWAQVVIEPNQYRAGGGLIGLTVALVFVMSFTARL